MTIRFIQSQCIGVLFSSLLFGSFLFAAEPSLEVIWRTEQGENKIGDFALSALPKKSARNTMEKDPLNGEMVRWEGYSLSALLDLAMEKMTVEQRADVDLLILVGRNGARATIPRSLAVKYRLVLASRRNGKELDAERGPLYSVMPWSSQEAIFSESLPLQKYFVPGLNRIELVHARNYFGPYFLDKRTDPKAVRGERLFVQTCMGCHDSGNNGKRDIRQALLLSTQKNHKDIIGYPTLSAAQSLAVEAYFRMISIQSANPTPLTSTSR